MPRTARKTKSTPVTLSAPAAPAAGVINLTQSRALAADGVRIDQAAGVIRNAAIMSVGPATGHGFELDHRSLQTLIEAFSANADNIKSRFTHPELDFTGATDGIEVMVGRPKNLRIEGDQVRGDIHLLQAAARSPRGDLRGYLLALAAEDPGIFGLSAVAGFDFENVVNQQTGDVERVLGRVRFLKAIDFVDDPASNRNGLLNTPRPQSGDAGERKNMNPRLRAFLESCGLAKDATDADATKALKALKGNDAAIAKILGSVAEGAQLSAEQTQALKDLGVDPKDPTKTLAAAPKTQPASNPSPGDGEPQPREGRQPAAGTETTPLTQADVNRSVTEALAAQRQQERERVNGIRTLASRVGLGDAWATEQITAGTDLDAVRESALEALATDYAPIPGLSRITGGEDGRASLVSGMTDALILRTGVDLVEYDDRGHPRLNDQGQALRRQPHERAGDFEFLSLIEMGRNWLMQLGVPTARLHPEQVARLCLDRFELAGRIGSVALAHSTSNFPGILGNVLNKMLLPAYEEENSTWELWALLQTVRDFRQVEFHSLGHVAAPPKVLEGAEYTYGTMSEKKEVGQVFKYGMLIALTWEMFINDDLSAFNDQAFGFAQSAHALENDLLYAQVIANPTMNEDSTALFHANHGNLNAGAGAAALDKDTLTDMRVGMALQRGLAPKSGTNGRRLNLRPNTILVPWELDVTASQLVRSTVEIGASNNQPNYEFIRSLRVVPESRLSDDSTTAHYVVAARNRTAPPAKVLKLRGFETPTVERLNTGSSVDGVTWKLRHVAGAAITDWRSWQKNDGA